VRLAHHADPFLHGLALVGIEHDTVAGIDECVDPRLGQLYDQLIAHQHREDLVMTTQCAATESRAAAGRRDVLVFHHFVDEPFESIFRRRRCSPRHASPSLPSGPPDWITRTLVTTTRQPTCGVSRRRPAEAAWPSAHPRPTARPRD